MYDRTSYKLNQMIIQWVKILLILIVKSLNSALGLETGEIGEKIFNVKWYLRWKFYNS